MNDVYVIAEAGVNHNGSWETSFEMIEVAKNAGADCIKFQAFDAEELVTKDAPKADYQQILKKESQYGMLKKLELSKEDFRKISNKCKLLKIDLLVTPFSEKWVKILCELGVKGFKISSGSINFLDLLTEVGKTGLPVILSTGMSTMEEIRRAINVLEKNGCGPLTLLHCVSLYPVPFEKINLFAMHALKEEFGFPVGFSDHSEILISDRVASLAVAAGAEVIERHFTLDRRMQGPDHKSSVNPCELGRYINAIRKVQIACGKKQKEISKEELKMKLVVRGSLVAKDDIKAGQIIFKSMLAEKRPGTGISPMEAHNIIGRQAIVNIKADDILKYEYFMEK